MSRGIFITFEGTDGAGKSTQIARLSECLRAHGRGVLELREPGGTSIGEGIRNILLDAKNMQMSARCELFLYEAARAQIVHEVIAPALEAGSVVICDRFYDSTFAYQACGRGLDEEFIARANEFATDGICPDKTLLLHVGGERASARVSKRGQKDRIELAGIDFARRVEAGFLELAWREPERIRLVDAAGSIDETFQNVCEELAELFPELKQGMQNG